MSDGLARPALSVSNRLATGDDASFPNRLPVDLEEEQARWLAPLRSRLLRRADIARRGRVLDLGAGWGTVARELARRAKGPVIAIDQSPCTLEERPQRDLAATIYGVSANAARLPLADATIDLAFCQSSLLWMPVDEVVAELRRVLVGDGVVVALEPDYGGMIEYPAGAGLGEVWSAALRRAGADPCVGRKLPALFSAAGFDVDVQLVPDLHPPSPHRFAMLSGLPLTAEESRQVAAARAQSQTVDRAMVHLPWFGITARCRR